MPKCKIIHGSSILVFEKKVIEKGKGKKIKDKEKMLCEKVPGDQ